MKSFSGSRETYTRTEGRLKAGLSRSILGKGTHIDRWKFLAELLTIKSLNRFDQPLRRLRHRDRDDTRPVNLYRCPDVLAMRAPAMDELSIVSAVGGFNPLRPPISVGSHCLTISKVSSGMPKRKLATPVILRPVLSILPVRNVST